VCEGWRPAARPERNVGVGGEPILAGEQPIARRVDDGLFLLVSLDRPGRLDNRCDRTGLGEDHANAIRFREFGIAEAERRRFADAADFTDLLRPHAGIAQFPRQAHRAMAGQPLVVVLGSVGAGKAVDDERRRRRLRPGELLDVNGAGRDQHVGIEAEVEVLQLVAAAHLRQIDGRLVARHVGMDVAKFPRRVLARRFVVYRRELPLERGRALAREPLLHDVRQLVRQQPRALGGVRRVLSFAEHNVTADGVGERIHRARGDRGARTVVHAHAGEIDAEAGFHERAGAGV
jgi:hypothetical protein